MTYQERDARRVTSHLNPLDRAGKMYDDTHGWCTVCGRTLVDASQGFDTCTDCVMDHVHRTSGRPELA